MLPHTQIELKSHSLSTGLFMTFLPLQHQLIWDVFITGFRNMFMGRFDNYPRSAFVWLDSDAGQEDLAHSLHSN